MRLFIDRIESGIATLLDEEGKGPPLHLPLQYLPVGVKEGMVVCLDIRIDLAATREHRARTQAIIESLPNEP